AVNAHLAVIHEQTRSTQSATVCSWLERALTWDVERLEAERDRFQAIYKPISILPPDQYLALVLQAAEGCSWNRCSFCTFYRDRKFRIKTPTAFRAHVQEVKAFIGKGIRMRKSLFLGDANALIIPQARLRELLKVVHEEFDVGRACGLKGLYAFLDIFGAEQKTVADYRELREAQVSRIYLGLESGDAEVFRLLNKPGSPMACVEAVRTIKAAGINVGIILLAGAGGARLAQQHVAHSLAALAAMGLGAGDLVYVSPLIVAPDGTYAQLLHEAASVPLEPSEVAVQLAQLKAGAKAVCDPGAKAALYHIEEFIY
ncbi:MAG: radical SAM protein, partial [Chloroflexia bacterium]|nr:radical SAM protein [Chloroflexia bacterium]